MKKLVYLELLKFKRLFLSLLLPIAILLPVVLVTIQYMVSEKTKSFSSTFSDSNIIIPICIFTVIIILANYIIAREYKENTITYISVTTYSKTKILLSKFLLIFITIICLEFLTFGLLIVVNFFLGGLTKSLVIKLLEVWVISSVMYFLLTPAVVFVALLRRNFISSLLISMIIFMFTFPFIFKNNYYIFPHLIPIVVVNEFLGVNHNTTPNYFIALPILLLFFTVFFTLCIIKFNKKE